MPECFATMKMVLMTLKSGTRGENVREKDSDVYSVKLSRTHAENYSFVQVCFLFDLPSLRV